MRMRIGVATAILVVVATKAVSQECDPFGVPFPCMAGMCQDGQCVGVPLNGGSCDDENACTTNDTCVDGDCMGTPTAAGPACDDNNECTTNDVCTDFFGTVACMGTPRETGTRCESDCGLCQPFVPGVPESGVLCKPDPERLNTACTPAEEFGPCFTGRCVSLGVPPAQISFCSGTLRTCPDDGNMCTGEFCNIETGECESAELPVREDCLPFECHRCEPGTGACVPANVGESCDDFNQCTGSTVCAADGGCVAGSPQQTATPTGTSGPGTPTPTSPVVVNTPTPTRTLGTPPPTPTRGRCVGDCNNNGEVRVNELITGVNIVLERAALEACPEFDVNGNSGVEVNELVAGVNSLIRGCVAAAALGR